VGADINDVVLGIGSDTRIGANFLQPGPGWGGSCFPKDSRALIKIAENAEYNFDLLKGVITVNDQQFDRVTEKIRLAAGGSVSGKVVAVWGLTFKAGTDDLRDSPSLQIIHRLLHLGAIIQAFDPTVTSHRSGLSQEIQITDSALACTRDAEVLVVLTEWSEFTKIVPSEVRAVMSGRTIVDGRNLLDRSTWQEAGFTHLGIGR
jgi:UDPglucose 6-dehydrogenase